MKKKERTLVAFDSQDFKILESERELLAIKGGKAGWVEALIEIFTKDGIEINLGCSHNEGCSNSNC